MFRIAKVFILPRRVEGSTLLQNVGGNITMLLHMQPGAKRHHMVSGILAPLYSFWVKVGLKRGSGPDRGRSPVEWGDFPFVRSFVRSSVCLFVPPSGPSSQA